jgi:ubiquinone/menaquinone biosynthesis C-methylase UbiE
MSHGFSGVPRGFRDVDADERRHQFSEYLERVARLIALEKVHSHDLMEPSPGKVLLDVGCGRGDDVRALADRVSPTGRVIGIDRSATLIHDARLAGPVRNADFQLADGHQLPFADDTFDAARVERTLQHVESPRRVLEEMVRVVRPGGIVVASEPDWGTLTIDSGDRTSTRELLGTLCDEHIRNGWIGRQLMALFTGLGLSSIEVHPATLVLRSLPVALEILGLSDVADRAPEWLSDLAERDTRTSFFASITGFTVTARVSQRA